jgi:WD40 repeat protein
MTEILSPSYSIESGAIPDCPYKGLPSYTEADADYFFGRDADRDLVIANLMASRLTVLYGPSGVGKSSLLQAGVMRHLRQMPEDAFSYLAVPNAIIVYHSSWHGASLAELGHALLQALPVRDDLEDIILERPPLSVELLRNLTERLDTDIYLLLDQFEEQTLYQTDDEGKAFLAELGHIITSPALRVSILLGVREDALAKLDPLKAYVPGLYDNNLRLRHLNWAAGREAIEGPLARYNAVAPPSTRHVTLEPELIDELLPQIQTGSVSVGDVGQGGVNTSEESIETPFLQLVMTRLWKEEAKLDSSVLRRKTLAGLGGADRIVRRHLDAVMSRLSEPQRDVAAEMFRYLVTPSGIKIPHTAKDLAGLTGEPQQVTEVLKRLAEGDDRVLRPVPPQLGSAEPTRYELFHDVMAPAVLDWRRRYVAERERIAREQEVILERRKAEEELRKTRRRVRLYALLSAALGLLLIMTTVTIALALNGRSVARAALLTQYHEQLAQHEAKLDSNPAASLRAALQAWDKLRTAEAKGAVSTTFQAEALEAEAQAAVRTALEADTQRLVLPAGYGDFTTSEFAPNGLTLLTAGSDGTSKLFDATTGKLIRVFKPGGPEPPSALRQASVSRDGTMVLTTAMDGTIHLYDIATGRDLGLLTRAPRAMWGTRNGRPVVLTFGNLLAASLWDPQGLSKIGEYGHKTVEAALSPDGRHILTVEVVLKGKKAITVWDAESGRKEQTSVPVGLLASQAQFAATGATDWGKVVFRANEAPNSWQVTLWDWGKGSNALLKTDSKSRQAGPIAVSTDGQFFAAAVDKHVTVFDTEQGKSIGDVPDQPDGINDLDLSVDGSWLATAGDDGRALVWKAHRFNNQPIAALLGHDRPIWDVRFDPSSPWRITTASGDGTARTWQLASHTDLTPGSHSVLDTDINGQLLVIAEDTGDLRVYKRRAGDRSDQWAQVAHTSLRGGGLGSARFTRDGRTVVTARLGDSAPSVWAWQSSNPPHRLTSSNRILTALAVSSDGQSVAAGDASNRVTVWDLASGGITAPLELGTDGYQVTGVTYIPRSTLIAAASTDGTVRLFDPVKPKQPLRTLGEVGGPVVKALDVSTDGAFVAAASEDRKVRIWRTPGGKPEQTIDGPSSTTADVAFSPDGKLVALAAVDGTVHIWEWRGNHKLAVLRRHVDAINSVQFSPDGSSIITAGDDAAVAIFSCTTCQPFEELLRIAEEQDRNHR